MSHRDAPLPDEPRPDGALPAHLQSQPWERYTRETDREWQLFAIHRDSAYPQGHLGSIAPRRLTYTAELTGASYEYLKQLSSSYSWAWRCAHFDREVDRRKTELSLSDSEKLARQRARVMRKARELAEAHIDKALQAAERDGPEGSAKISELVQLLQLTFGRPDEEAAQAGSQGATSVTIDLAKARPSLDELRALQAVVRRQALPTPSPPVVETTGSNENATPGTESSG